MEKLYTSFQKRFQDSRLAANLVEHADEAGGEGDDGVDGEAGENDVSPDYCGGDEVSEEDDIGDDGGGGGDVQNASRSGRKQPKGMGKGKEAEKGNGKGKGKGQGTGKRANSKTTAAASASDDTVGATTKKTNRKSRKQTLLPTGAADSAEGGAVDQCM